MSDRYNLTSQSTMYISDSVLIGQLCIVILMNVSAAILILTTKSLRAIINNIILALLFGSHIATSSCIIVITSTYRKYPQIVQRLQEVRDLFSAFEVGFTIFLSLERYIAIQKPFLYSKLSARHFFISLLTIFCLSIGFFIWRHFSLTAYIFGMIFTTCGCVFICYACASSYRTIKTQCRKISATIVTKSNEQKVKRKTNMRKLQVRSLKICFWIALTYLLTWVPLSIYTFVNNFRREKLPLTYTNLAIMFGYSNGIMDVLIFLYVNNTAKQRLCGIFNKPKDGQVSAVSPVSGAVTRRFSSK